MRANYVRNVFIQGHMTEHVRTVHEGKKRIYKEVNCQVINVCTLRNILMLFLLALWKNLPEEMGSEHSHIIRPC